MDLALKAGLSLRDVADWTPGMVCDLIFCQSNAREQQAAPKPPDQNYFDNF